MSDSSEKQAAMRDAVLIVKKTGSIPFTKRPAKQMKALIVEARSKYDPCCEMIVAWTDHCGKIQVESVEDVLLDESAMQMDRSN